MSAAGCDLVQGYMFGKPDSVAKHENAYPVFPLNTSGGRWFPQLGNASKTVTTPPKIKLAPKLAQGARAMGEEPDQGSVGKEASPEAGAPAPFRSTG